MGFKPLSLIRLLYFQMTEQENPSQATRAVNLMSMCGQFILTSESHALHLHITDALPLPLHPIIRVSRRREELPLGERCMESRAVWRWGVSGGGHGRRVQGGSGVESGVGQIRFYTH